jgi:ATP-dependent Clp protease ATP-binding subunit ClpC
VRENEGVAARILLDFDADAEKVRDAVIRMLGGPGRRQTDEGFLPGESRELAQPTACAVSSSTPKDFQPNSPKGWRLVR